MCAADRQEDQRQKKVSMMIMQQHLLHLRLWQMGKLRDSTRFQGAESLGARGSGCTHTKQWQIELCRLQVQHEADRPEEQSLLVVSPCNEKLILDLHMQGLHLPHHVHGKEHVDNVLGWSRMRQTPN